jgi:ubiquinone/menaquinone biosynthesis C-methylase UbiE
VKTSTILTKRGKEISTNIKRQLEMGGRIQREAEFHDRLVSQKPNRVNCYSAGGNRRALTELVRLAGNLDGKKVLEFGCGSGWLTIYLAQPGAHVFAFDISEESLKVAAKYAAKHGVVDRISFRKENAEALSYPDNSFDVVVGGAILHHLDIEKASREIYRVLKKKGRAFFLEPLGHNPFINLYRKMTPLREHQTSIRS